MNSHLYETKRKEDFKKTQQGRAYIYLLNKNIIWKLIWSEIFNRKYSERFLIWKIFNSFHV